MQLAALRQEQVRLDRRSLAELTSELGPRGAAVVAARASDDLTERLVMLEILHRSGAWALLADRVQRLPGIADQIGMTHLAQVARDVACCAERRDAPALAATLARLGRVARGSVAAIRERQG